MTAVATTFVGTQLYTAREARKAQGKARSDAKEDERQARKAAVFAETEGMGIGNLGQVSLDVDEDLDEEELLRKQGSTRVSL